MVSVSGDFGELWAPAAPRFFSPTSTSPPFFSPNSKHFIPNNFTSLLHFISIKMGVEKKTLVPGNGVDFPKKGDNIAMHYNGCLYDASKADNHFMGFK